MKIWYLKAHDIDSWPYLTFDCVVVAPDEKQARETANQGCHGDWLNTDLVECRELLANEYKVNCLITSSDDCASCCDRTILYS